VSDYRLLTAGDTALVVEFGDRIDRRLNQKVLALARRIAEARIDGIIETVPTFRSLMVYYEPLIVSRGALAGHIEEMMARGLRPVEGAGQAWHIPVCYDERLAPDLLEVAAATRLDPAEVVARHSAITYDVYMLGFLPGQAYMGDLPADLCLPRRETPRLRIPAGSLAIAMNMTCIFPLETPCGWHLIGRSPVPLWSEGNALLAPGDRVSFDPVSFEQYEDLAADAAEGVLKVLPSGGIIGAAA
jgi:KipI family sensor histidine kinase inhibitor